MRSVLGLDTGSRLGSIALAIDGRAVSWEPLRPGGHSSGLSAAAQGLLDARGLSLASLEGIAVSGGPGSFTGLRIGLAWAKGAALGLSIPITLISAHDASAHAFRSKAERIVTVLPGERGHVEVARWLGGERIRPVTGPDQVPEESLAAALADRELAPPGVRLLIAAGDLPGAIVDILRGGGRTVLDPARAWDDGAVPLGAAVAELGAAALREGRAADWTSAAPAYGRAPNARKPAP